MSARRKPKPTKAATPTASRFGHADTRTGAWIGRPQELGSDAVALDPARPQDLTTVARVQSGILALLQAKRISGSQAAAATRYADDWSVGTGVPLRASEARFLGVSLGGASHADGVPIRVLDAASRHREASLAIGRTATDRMTAFACLGTSMTAAAKLLGIDRRDLGILLIADIERLAEHYADIDKSRDKASWNAGRRA